MSIQKYKRVITTTTVALVAAIIGFIAYSAFSKSLDNAVAQNAKRQQKELVTIAANEIEKYFYDIQKRMETIAAMSDIRDAQRSEACNLKLQKLVEVNSRELNNLGRVSKEGTFICAVNRTIIGEPVSKYGDYFQKIANSPEHKPSMSRLIFPSGSASSVVAVHVPVYDSSGNFNGTIGGAVYFDELQRRILAGTQINKDNVLVLYDENLDVLYNPDPLIRGKNLNSPEIKGLYAPESAINDFMEKIKKGASENETSYSFRNIHNHVTYKSVRVIDRRWTVAIAVPTATLQELSGSVISKNLFIGMTIALVVTATFAANIAQRPKASKPKMSKADK